jgi:hypothetical protein
MFISKKQLRRDLDAAESRIEFLDRRYWELVHELELVMQHLDVRVSQILAHKTLVKRS